MNKHLIVIGIVVLLLVVGLSGCEELQTGNGSDTTGDTDKVELVSYTVTTQWATPHKDYWGTITYDDYKTTSGIRKNQPYNSEALRYYISGTVKNIAGEKLSRITITVKFYDSNSNYLDTKKDYVYNIANSYTEDFVIEYFKSNKYFEDVDSVKLEVIAS